MTAAAIRATFSDWRTVKSRKMLQLVFEVPLEQQADVLAILGAPLPDETRWCGIALLQPSQHDAAEREPSASCPLGPAAPVAIQSPLGGGENTGARNGQSESADLASGRVAPSDGVSGRSEGERTRIRAVMLCKDERFCRWMGGRASDMPMHMRHYLGISSRREIATDPEALRRFLALERRFKVETGQVTEER